MNRTENSAQNLAFGFINRIVSLFFVFISRKLFIYFIGIEYLGINSLFSNVLSILSMADLGFGIAMSYSFYKPLAENDTRKISALIGFYKHIYNIIAISVFVLGMALLPFLQYIVNLNGDIPYLKLYYVVFLLQTVVSYLFVYKTTIIVADQKNYIINKISTLIEFVKTFAQNAIIVLTKNYFLYILAQLIGTFLNNYIASREADKLYPYINEKDELKDEEKKDVFSNMKAIFIYKISGTLMNSIDSICISTICGTIVLGYYVNYLTITNQIEAIIAIVFSSFTASIGNLITNKNKENNLEVFNSLQLLSGYFSAITFLGFIFLSQEFIGFWLGDEYLLDNFTIIVIAFNLYLGMSFRPLWSYREATGLYVKTKYVMLIAAGLNIILSIGLGMVMGVAGVVLASILCRLFTYFWYEPVILYKDYFGVSPVDFFKKYAINLISVALLCAEIFIIFNIISWKEGTIFWCIKGIILVTIVSINYYLVFRNTSSFKYVKSKAENIVRRKLYKRKTTH